MSVSIPIKIKKCKTCGKDFTPRNDEEYCPNCIDTSFTVKTYVGDIPIVHQPRPAWEDDDLDDFSV